ncbi:MAG: hypothetical protein PHV30_01535 [Candidatus Margulisbacteria bacterium]|nr:hypothetical protein [Candidatus Margulisiibacteriota bacterium]
MINEKIKDKKQIPVLFVMRTNKNGNLTKNSTNEDFREVALTPIDIYSSYIDIGMSKRNDMKYKEALKAFSAAIDIDDSQASAYFNRAIVKEELKDYEGALNDYDQVIYLDNHYTEAYIYRGELKAILKDDMGSIRDFLLAIYYKIK